MKKEILSKKFWILMAAICGGLLFILLMLIIAFNARKPEVVEEEMNGASVTLNYTGNNTGLQLNDVLPTTEAVAIADTDETKYFEFSVDTEITKAKQLEYEIYIVPDKTASTITNEDIRIYLEKEKDGTYTKVFGPSKFIPLKKDSKLGTPSGSMVLLNEKKTKSSKDNYRLRMWLADTSTIASGSYRVEVLISAKAS